MSMVDDLRNMLIAHGIDGEKYTDTMLESIITEARLLVDEPYMFDTESEDYTPDFCDDIYMTEDYPVIPESLHFVVDGEEVTPRKVTSEGIVYLPGRVSGELTCTYTVGLGSDDIQQYMLPICVSIVKDSEGQNVAGVTEGDVSTTYYMNYGNTDTTSIDSLVMKIRNKYSGRVCFI